MAEKSAKFWIQKLGLQPHPEGGYFRQTYKAEMIVPKEALPGGFTGPRAASTAIYFLLEGDNFSALHRLRSDEVWHFYAGSALIVHVIDPDGNYSRILVGDDPDAGEVLQAVVRAGTWFGASLPSQKSFALVGCTVSPGFDFEDFEMARRADLLRAYPQHRDVIQELTRR